eukprot:gene688-797_t
MDAARVGLGGVIHERAAAPIVGGSEADAGDVHPVDAEIDGDDERAAVGESDPGRGPAGATSCLGGQGVPVRCDHTDEAQVRELFARVEREAGRLDLLVNNAWGGHESFNGVFEAPFWEHPLSNWEAMFDRGVRNHLVASRCAAPLLVRQGRGLIATTTFWDRDRYLRGSLFYDLAKAAMTRLAFSMAQDLRAHGVASVAVSPGWMRTEFVLAGHQTDEAHWKERPALA